MSALVILAASHFPTCTPPEVFRMNHSDVAATCVLPHPPFPKCREKIVIPCWYSAETADYVINDQGAYRWTGEVR